MVVFPAFSALITLACAAVIARDAIARPRPDKLAWMVAFAIFALAAGAEVVGSLAGWTVSLVRIYYLAGAVLVVGYLALGQLYLLAANRIQRIAPGATLLVTAIAATIVLNAPVDETRLASDGWDAIERGTALKTLAIGINSIGTLIIVGGLIYSAWRFKHLGIQRNRMIGCLLIALGTMTVGMGGTLTRFGHHEYLYIAMSIGSAIIFAGYLRTRKPRASSSKLHATSAKPAAANMLPPGTNGHGEARLVTAGVAATGKVEENGHHPEKAREPIIDPGIAFIEARLAEMTDDDLSEMCRVWSVARPETDAFERDEARRAWSLRLSLSTGAQLRFDALPIAVRLQLTELYHEVMANPTAASRSRSKP